MNGSTKTVVGVGVSLLGLLFGWALYWQLVERHRKKDENSETTYQEKTEKAEIKSGDMPSPQATSTELDLSAKDTDNPDEETLVSGVSERDTIVAESSSAQFESLSSSYETSHELDKTVSIHSSDCDGLSDSDILEVKPTHYETDNSKPCEDCFAQDQLNDNDIIEVTPSQHQLDDSDIIEVSEVKPVHSEPTVTTAAPEVISLLDDSDIVEETMVETVVEAQESITSSVSISQVSISQVETTATYTIEDGQTSMSHSESANTSYTESAEASASYAESAEASASYAESADASVSTTESAEASVSITESADLSTSNTESAMGLENETVPLIAEDSSTSVESRESDSKVNNGAAASRSIEIVNEVLGQIARNRAEIAPLCEESTSDSKSDLSVTDSGISVATVARAKTVQTQSTKSSCLQPNQKLQANGVSHSPNSAKDASQDGAGHEAKPAEPTNGHSCPNTSPQNGSDKLHESLNNGLPKATEESKKLSGERVTHSFLLPSKICGLFIGKAGRKITALKHQTNTSIIVGREPLLSGAFRHCSIEGFKEDVARTLQIIRTQYPEVDTKSITPGQPALQLSPDRMQLHLPMGVTVDVVVSNVVSAGHVFVQQPTHPSYSSYQRLVDFMREVYCDGSTVPPMPTNVEDGVLCVAPILNNWYRAHIMAISSDRLFCEIKLVDVGGYSMVELARLRQIRQDFLNLPFQAVECYLANIEPLDGKSFSEEADSALNELTRNRVMQCQPVAVAENSIPYIHLMAQQPDHTAIIVNQELVKRGLVNWYDLEDESTQTVPL